ncbi:tumor necrosis factor receptor superfamily member 13B [Lates calcarifer]|uniref:Tumor necrosis factor receptor superfamily member 13B n=1 Tax=Lates calcarifer TaxID=8187 RepID=A0AAJ7VL18_LATCA|nr:tumor necrosis factor receptor superfamily member 13B [Lates calcarifer]
MGGRCHEGWYWDALVKRCITCQQQCESPPIHARCTSYCESAQCKKLPGRHYDGLLKTCIICAEVCGRHPAECSQHCQNTPLPVTTKKLLTTPPHVTTKKFLCTPPPVTTKKLLTEVISQMPNPRGLPVPTLALEDPTVLLYSLLALCMVLLFSSLSLTLAVFLRGSRAKTSKPGPKEASQNQERLVQPGKEVRLPVGHLGQTSKDFVTSPSCPTDREPSEDTSPTETCVCVHCFPDLKALGQGNDRPPRAPFSFYQQAVLPTAQIQKGGPLWTEESHHISALGVQEEAAVR